MTDRSPNRSYDQWCGLALALDHLGDRWTLLIVRELLAGPRRYTDLRENLPGIATNLLAQRLRDLESDGLIVRRALPPPTPTTLYELTPNGAELEPAVLTLTRWGSRLMPAAEPSTMRPSWFALAMRASLEPRVTTSTPQLDAVFADVDGTDVLLRVRRGDLQISPGAAIPTTGVVRVEGDPHALLAVVTGGVSLREARRDGVLTIRGPRAGVAVLSALLTAPAQGAA